MAYIYDLSDQWTAAGTTFTAIKMSVTDTASAAGSLLMDLQVGGSSKFSVNKSGQITAIASGNTYLFQTDVATWAFSTSGFGGVPQSAIKAGTFQLSSTGFFAFSSGSSANGTLDTILARDAANTLAQRNSTNPQAFNLYNTYSTVSDYERGFMRFVSNVLQIGTEKNGTSMVARALALQVDGSTRLSISTNENYSLGAQNTSSGGSGFGSTAIGRLAIATAAASVSIGHGGSVGGTASGDYAMVVANELNTGNGHLASGTISSIFGGSGGLADKWGQSACGFGGFAVRGDAQASSLGFVGATTDATATEIFLFNRSNQRAVVPANKTWAFVLTAVARSSGGTDNAMYVRRGIIKRDGANNTVLVGAVDSVYTNETNAAWDIDVSADDTNESLKVTVTGAAATNIRWVAKVELTEVLFS